jgi:predicted DNA-binding ribbon-helix-helix protein
MEVHSGNFGSQRLNLVRARARSLARTSLFRRRSAAELHKLSKIAKNRENHEKSEKISKLMKNHKNIKKIAKPSHLRVCVCRGVKLRIYASACVGRTWTTTSERSERVGVRRIARVEMHTCVHVCKQKSQKSRKITKIAKPTRLRV